MGTSPLRQPSARAGMARSTAPSRQDNDSIVVGGTELVLDAAELSVGIADDDEIVCVHADEIVYVVDACMLEE
eukprot:3890796-Heterocapsa_arctica.AAC.1